MPICKQIEDLIPLYNSGDLDTAEKLQVENHLAECSECRELRREMQNMQNILRPGEITIDPNYGAELVVNIQNRFQNRRRHRKLMYYLIPAFSSLVIMVVLGFNIIGNNSLSKQWTKNSTIVDLYADLVHSGYFSEEPEIVFDQLNTGENEQISDEIQQNLRQEIIAASSPTPVDNYVVATAHLNDQDFESFLKKVEDFTL
ncbi:MAG: zf-HC2 domain-containing protein [Candidatus Neomarinimicrobiota bacterium]